MSSADYMLANETRSEFSLIKKAEEWSDKLFLFLQNVFHLYPEDKFHSLILRTLDKSQIDNEIYEILLKELSEIKPALQPFSHGLPALKVQKEVMSSQTLELLNGNQQINGLLEIGSPGRYVSHFRQFIKLSGDVCLMNDTAPGYNLPDIFERGGLRKIGRFVPLNNYKPIPQEEIKDNSMDMVTCYIGLHHSSSVNLGRFVESIRRVLRPGGRFILRDHDANTPDMKTFASLIHTVFNAGLGVDWKTNSTEIRNFKSITDIKKYLVDYGFKGDNRCLFQKNDPSLNALMVFTKA